MKACYGASSPLRLVVKMALRSHFIHNDDDDYDYHVMMTTMMMMFMMFMTFMMMIMMIMMMRLGMVVTPTTVPTSGDVVVVVGKLRCLARTAAREPPSVCARICHAKELLPVAVVQGPGRGGCSVVLAGAAPRVLVTECGRALRSPAHTKERRLYQSMSSAAATAATMISAASPSTSPAAPTPALTPTRDTNVTTTNKTKQQLT
jgi:hypothetical protein